MNVALGTGNGAVWMEVDGRKLDFVDCMLNTFGSMVNLRGKLGTLGPDIKFEYDGRSVVARFKGRPVIELMQVQGDELEIRYAQSKDEKHVYRTNLKSG